MLCLFCDKWTSKVVPNLQTRPYRPDQTTCAKIQTYQTRPCTCACSNLYNYRPDQNTCAKIARGEIASYRPTRPGHARARLYSDLQTRPDQTACAKIVSYRPGHARAPVIYRPDQTRPGHADPSRPSALKELQTNQTMHARL